MHTNNSIIAFIPTLHAIELGMRRYNIAENAPTRPSADECTTPGCGRHADVRYEDAAPLCGRCYLVVIGDIGEEVLL